MDNINEISTLMGKLFEEMELANPVEDKVKELTFPTGAKELIKEIADFARKSKFYIENKERTQKFWTSMEATPTKVLLIMLDKYVNAPTKLHEIASVLAHMPMLDDLINTVNSYE